MARKTKKQKYKRWANKIRKTIKTWKEKGSQNVVHYLFLLSAEHAVLNKNYQAAMKHYKQAIVFAARSGHLHDAGLFNERYADFLRHRLGDEDEANYRLNEAIKFYSDWGAKAKVELLEGRLIKLIPEIV